MPAKKAAPEATRLTIRVRDLMQLVNPVIPCAGKDDMLPILTCILIESHGQWLVASGTDRFRIGVKRVKKVVDAGDEADGEWPAFKALVPRSTLATIFRHFKATKGFDPEITLTVSDDSQAVRVESAGTLGEFTAASITYPLMVGDYPNLFGIVTEALDREPEAVSRFNWKFMAEFAAADPHGYGLTVRTHKTHATIITDGEDFIGVIMPRRPRERGKDPYGVPADWFDILPKSGTKAAKAS